MLQKYYFWCFQDSLPKTLPFDLMRFAEENSDTEHEAQVGMGNKDGVNKGIRQSNVNWFGQGWVHRHFTTLVQRANQMAGWNFEITGAETLQYTKYKLNGFYDWHFDTHEIPYLDPYNSSTYNKTRKISMSCVLTDGDEYEGGDFQLKFPGGEVVTIPELRKRGTVVVFPSYLHHRVTPVTSGSRISMVMWSLGPPFR